MKGKAFRYGLLLLCVVAILFALYKVLFVKEKRDTYLALGDYLSVSGKIDDEEIKSFSSLLGDYFIDSELIKNVNSNYVSPLYDSEMLLEMISRNAYSGKDDGLVEAIKRSEYITVSVGMNDIIDYIRYDSSQKKVIYDRNFIKRKIEIMKQNYYEIVDELQELNDKSKVYLVGYYYPYCYEDEVCKKDVSEVFGLLNESIKDVSVASNVYYVDISEVGKQDYMYNKNQIYLNQLGHEYVFSVFKSKYLE